MTAETANPTLPAQGSEEAFGSSPSTKAATKSTDNSWYYLKISYNDNNGAPQTGYPYENTSDYWNHYLIITPGGPFEKSLRFKKYASIINPDGKEWIQWQQGNGRYLSVRSEGWMKSQVEGANPPKWNGGFDGNFTLTNDYNNFPVSIVYQSVPFEGYFYWLYAKTQTNAAKCEWVKIPD